MPMADEEHGPWWDLLRVGAWLFLAGCAVAVAWEIWQAAAWLVTLVRDYAP